MNPTDDHFVRDRLTTWQRRIQTTSADLAPPQTGSAQAALAPVLHQLVSVYNLSSGLVADLHQSADSPLATISAGREYLGHLAAALAHINRAAAHLSTTVIGLTDAHRHTPRPGTAAPVESQLAVTLGHSAALRSLHRALEAVTSPLAGPEQNSGPSSAPVIGEHSRAADASGTQPTRRR
ncbi:hypothetical protein [Streptomyces sp. SID13726]|uniref:hypothetical protein n=1 Tax=Streptomyces sp. SID13726 TaxID=2706058 RepID=UPI0013BE088C|nr:hypothetical protein [Streptomyces sp. SID13726]NEB01970.1 hypothetical protein [Streptomyces sp. SID13726]